MLLKSAFMEKFLNRSSIAHVLTLTVMVLLAALFFNSKAWCTAGTEKEHPESHKAAADLNDLSNIDNKELFQRAEKIYYSSSSGYLATLRTLARVKIKLQRMGKKTKEFQPPVKVTIPVTFPHEINIDQKVKSAADNARKRLTAFQQQLSLLKTEKTVLMQYIKKCQEALTAAENFHNKVILLDRFFLEVNLRIKDKTVLRTSLPGFFNSQQLLKHKKNLALKVKKLSDIIEASRLKIKTLEKQTKHTSQLFKSAELNDKAADRALFQLQKITSLDKKYLNLSLDEFISTFSELMEERIWLKGSLNLSLNQFNKTKNRIEAIEKKLEKLTLPKVVPYKLKGRAISDHGSVVKKAEININYQKSRINMLNDLLTALKTLIKHGTELKGDILVFDMHLVKLQVAAKVLSEKKNLSLESVSEFKTEEQLKTERLKVIGLLSELTDLFQKTGTKKTKVLKKIKQAGTVLHQVKKELADFLKTEQFRLKSKEWEKKFQDKPADQVVLKFHSVQAELKKNIGLLEKKQLKLKKAHKNVKEWKEKLKHLQYPLLKTELTDFSVRKELVAKELSKIAQKNAKPFSLDKISSKQIIDETKQEISMTAVTAAEYFQNVLSSRIRINKKQDQVKNELLKSFKNLNQNFDRAMLVQEKIKELKEQLYALAVEIKKRTGREELKPDEIPDGVNTVLNRDYVAKLKKEKKRNLYFHDRMRHETDLSVWELIALSDSNKMAKTRELAGKAIDLNKEFKGLKKKYLSFDQAVSKTKAKKREQQAIRRMKMDNTFKDSLLGFVTSERIRGLKVLLQNYYKDLLLLNEKQGVVQEQKQIINKLLILSKEEKTADRELLILFKTYRERLIKGKHKETAYINAVLLPEQAQSFIDRLESSTGEKLIKPVPVPEEKSSIAIEGAADALVTLELGILAADKWIELLAYRLSSKGLQADAGKYQDQLGVLNSNESAVIRHITGLTGKGIKPEDEYLKKAEAETEAETEAEAEKESHVSRSLVKGDIGAVRNEIEDIRYREAFWVFVKLAFVILSALVLNFAINRLFYFLTNSAKMSKGKNAQTIFAFSFFRAMFKVILWIVTVIVTFNFLGFNIAAVLAGLGIGGLAIAMAARETIADILGGIMIFLERPFNIGDVVQIGSSTAKVIGISWRSTRLITAFNYTINIPNSHVTESTITNFTKMYPYGDYISLFVSAKHDPLTVIPIIESALEKCTTILTDKPKGVTLAGTKVFDNVTLMEYWPYWYIDDYLGRNNFRNEVWKEIWNAMSKTNIELHFNPFDRT